MLYLLLGQKQSYETDGEKFLRYLLGRYSLHRHLYRLGYCYDSTPRSTAKERRSDLEASRKHHERYWVDPWTIIGFGWMAAELLTGRGKTKLKTLVGTKWTYVGNIVRECWISYDPAAALFDPNIAVDISAVILAAAKLDGLTARIDPAIKFDWQPYI